MRAARKVVVVSVLAAVGIAGAWLAHLHVVSQTYHPVVRLASPDGLTYTAVQDAKRERRACGNANHLFLEPVKKVCKECKVVVARCERQLEGFELAVHEGRQTDLHLVRGPGVHVAIAGPAAAARANCEYIAGQMIASGVRSAACVYPS